MTTIKKRIRTGRAWNKNSHPFSDDPGAPSPEVVGPRQNIYRTRTTGRNIARRKNTPMAMRLNAGFGGISKNKGFEPLHKLMMCKYSRPNPSIWDFLSPTCICIDRMPFQIISIFNFRGPVNFYPSSRQSMAATSTYWSGEPFRHKGIVTYAVG
ncbi:hypothetical protein LCGC14_1173450 [marine sediment metagenome]|uniref:Uncharacterized protein n=1 Tax=marine sediment metagenome TaxID=412755 RepID=A0A0F9LPC6_9ZZZZ